MIPTSEGSVLPCPLPALCPGAQRGLPPVAGSCRVAGARGVAYNPGADEIE